MIRFIDINSGRTFNGDRPYVHWFEGQQSTGLIYVNKIIVLSDQESLRINLSPFNNNVFHLIDPDKILTSDEYTFNDCSFKDIEQMYSVFTISKGGKYGNNFVHIIYIAAEASSPAEYRQVFTINGEDYIVGADFYDDREELKLNLENFGVELPDSIQKAIHDSNVREEAVDNILMNRKYKELLMDYISILGNRGSYESLLNSLKWFGYDDMLKIREFWKHNEWGKDIFDMQDLTQTLNHHTSNMLANYIKTTYMGIYCACQKELTDENGNTILEEPVYPNILKGVDWKNAEVNHHVPDNGDEDGSVRQHLQIGPDQVFFTPFEGDDEFEGANFEKLESYYKDKDRILAEPVPALKNNLMKWSMEDMSIKMAILGNFFERYFMPIHTDLIHSTLENVVYTTAAKLISGGQVNRTDHILQKTQVKCNIKNDSVFELQDVSVQANSETPFVKLWNGEDYDEHDVIGVNDLIIIDSNDNYATIPNSVPLATRDEDTDEYTDIPNELSTELKHILTNTYNGIGTVIPFKFTIPVNEDDVINKEIICYESDITGKWASTEYNYKYSAIQDENGKYFVEVSFNMLFTKDRDYDMRMEFRNTNGQVYIKRIRFSIVDTRRAELEIYKIKPSYTDASRDSNDYMFSHTRHYDDICVADIDEQHKYYMQYISVPSNPNDTTSDGVKLRLIVILRNSWGDTTESNLQSLIRTTLDKELPSVSDENKIDNKKVKSRFSRGIALNNENLELLNKNYDGRERSALLAWQWLCSNFTRKLKSGQNNDGSNYSYYIYIADKFNVRDNNNLIDTLRKYVYEECGCNDLLVRQELIYLPQYHYLAPLDRSSLKGLSVNPTETLCVIPNIKYLQHINEYEWIFRNASTLHDYTLPSIKEPFIASNDKEYPILPAGYYDVIFRYKLSNMADQLVDTQSSRMNIQLSGVNLYVHFAWCNTDNNFDNSFTTSKNNGLDYKYVGICIDKNEKDPIEFSSYQWRNVHDYYKDHGYPVQVPALSKKYNIHYAWCNTVDNSDNSFTEDRNFNIDQKYIGICLYRKDNDKQSHNFSDYHWINLEYIDTSNGEVIKIYDNEYRLHLAWCNNMDNTDNSFTTSKDIDKKYPCMGICIDKNIKDPDYFMNYDWISLPIQNNTNRNFLDEISVHTTHDKYYIHFAWCNDVSITKDFSLSRGPLSNYRYMGIHISTDVESPADVNMYYWIYIKEDIHEVCLSSAFIQLDDNPSSLLRTQILDTDEEKHSTDTQVQQALLNSTLNNGKYAS